MQCTRCLGRAVFVLAVTLAANESDLQAAVIQPNVTFIPAADRFSTKYDNARGVLYISSLGNVLRYDLASNAFLNVTHPFVSVAPGPPLGP